MTAATAASYVEFAEREARGVSASYERLSRAVAHNGEILSLVETLPPSKRQPNLLFAVVRLLGGPVDDPDAFHHYVTTHWPLITAELLVRLTQTNEPGRCAVLLPVLAALPQPLALLEVGASAGLCLYPDRYGYEYSRTVLGDGQDPVLRCTEAGMQPPAALPQVVWRAGIDINPLDVREPTDVAWLDALIWPEHTHRRARLRAAIAMVAATGPPLLVRGDLIDELPQLAAQAPADATLVIFHTSVIAYLPEPRQREFGQLAARICRQRGAHPGAQPGHWIANEVPQVLPFDSLPEPPDTALYNVLALDGTPLAYTRPHGQAMTWFGPPLG